MSQATQLAAIFTAERNLRRAEAELMQGERRELARLLSSAVEEAKSLEDPHEAELRLTRLADLCAQVPGPEMVEALVRILDDENPSVRVQAAEALVDVAFDRYAEVARAVERALDEGSRGPAMRELPWVIAEVAEPSAGALIRGFLGHDDADVVASGVEALAQLGDPSSVPALEKLKDDPRPVTIDDDEETTATLGELAREAIEALG